MMTNDWKDLLPKGSYLRQLAEAREIQEETKKRCDEDPNMFVDSDGSVIKLHDDQELPSAEETVAKIKWDMTMPKYGTPDDVFDSEEAWFQDKMRLAADYI